MFFERALKAHEQKNYAVFIENQEMRSGCGRIMKATSTISPLATR